MQFQIMLDDAWRSLNSIQRVSCSSSPFSPSLVTFVFGLAVVSHDTCVFACVVALNLQQYAYAESATAQATLA